MDKGQKPNSLKQSVLWSVFWIGLAVAFGVGLFFYRGSEAATAFFTAYLIEKALSIDNLFVFALIFSQFNIPPSQQRTMLYWGILGALVLRGLMIFAGIALLTRFHWVFYAFGAVLILSAVKMALPSNASKKPKLMLKAKPGGGLSPFWAALITIEFADLLFAVDSVPAVLAVSVDPLLVYSSNIFAILGLRSLYFLLAAAMERVVGLHLWLALILAFVGVKMVLAEVVDIPTYVSLIFIGVVFAGAALVTLLRRRTP